MNRRSFLLRLGAAATGAAAMAVIDPEQLLWVPGAKTIIDFGATKQVLPATDREVVRAATAALSDDARQVILSGTPYGGGHDWLRRQFLEDEPRDIRLDLPNANGGLTSFQYRRDKEGERLVSVHSAAELELLNRPMFGRGWADLADVDA